MVVWINGAFGVGKTSVARELVQLMPAARLVDPERIGGVMRRTLWRGRDYQDIDLWARLVRRQVRWHSRSAVAVVPMTVVHRTVFDAVTADARVFLLTAERRSIEQRIDASGEAIAWRRGNLERCLDAFATGAFGEAVSTEDRSPLEVARIIAARL